MKKRTLSLNIKALMVENEMTAISIDKKLEFPLGTMTQKLFKNHRNIKSGFTVSDIARLMTLFDCGCDKIFKGVDFTRGEDDK